MKRYGAISLAVLASLLIWLASNLSEKSTGIISVPVSVSSKLVGYSTTSVESVSISAVVSGSAYALTRKSIGRSRPVKVEIDAADFQDLGEGVHQITSGALFRYANEIFGKSVTVQSFVTDRFQFRFQAESYKRVPVVPVATLRYSDQYMGWGGMKLMPDSVEVYGDPERIRSIEMVLTSQISKRDIKGDQIHGTAKLEVPAGLRLSNTSVNWSQRVARFVEIRSTATVGVRNVPEGKNLAVYPSTIGVICRYAFPLSGSSSRISEFYVDYADFAVSKTGKCIVKADGIPSSLIEWKADPEACECFETE